MDIPTPTEASLALVVGVRDLWADVHLHQLTPLDLGVALVTVGTLAGFRLILREWAKRIAFNLIIDEWTRREGMVLKDRNDRIHATWLDIIQDGVDKKLEKGEISPQEAKAMFAYAADKLDLLDLIPKKRIAPLVKSKLKKDQALRTKARKDGTYVEKAPIPGDPPTPIVRAPFSERLGKAVKFWQKTAA